MTAGSHEPGKLFTPKFHDMPSLAGMKTFILVALVGIFDFGRSQNVKFLVVTESAQPQLTSNFTEGLKQVQDSNPGVILDINTISFTRRLADDAYIELCSKLQSDTYTAIIDMAWGGWIKVNNTKCIVN